ncbi:MAG: hypothetical protein HKN74_06605 [Acidimicrobiia bacterium]|nr:hypothetical protein [Acidimicrobiia bacterium]NNF09937.1 hypothetical protein [Acidimicrobiia bacterium]NNL69599.1 hypothetical protein [Acidimicrobiia bacterium]
MDHTLFFPEVSATSLAGESFEFPDSFGADLTLVLLGFRGWQRPAMKSWVRTARMLELQAPGFEYFEMPVIQEASPEAPQAAETEQLDAAPDRLTREKTVPLHVDTAGFLRRFGLPTDEEMYAVLLDSHGLILRIWTGTATDRSRTQLVEFVRTAEVVVEPDPPRRQSVYPSP